MHDLVNWYFITGSTLSVHIDLGSSIGGGTPWATLQSAEFSHSPERPTGSYRHKWLVSVEEFGDAMWDEVILKGTLIK